MNTVVLYFVFLKATLTSFSGMTSIPVIHDELIERRKVLTERQLNSAVAMARLSPGPNGLYLVCTGYLIAGVPGAAAGFLAMITPAFLIVPLLRRIGRRAENEQVKRCIRAVMIAASGLVASAAMPLARDAIRGWPAGAIAAVTCGLLAFTEIDTVWVLLGAAICGFLIP